MQCFALSREGYRQARWFLQRVRQAQDREEGEHCFEELCQVVAEEKPRWAKELRDKAASYLAFLEYPEEVRSHIYSINPVESLNSGIEAMRIHLGGYFPSQNSLEVNLFVQIVNWQDSWSRRPVPTIRAVSYKLHQLFALRYELDREEEIMLHISEEADRVKPLFFYSFSPPWPTFLQLFPIHLSVPSSTIYPLRLGLPNQN